VDDFARLLALVDTGGQPIGWLHTGVLFLQIYATSGHSFYPGFGPKPADGADWQQYVDSLMGTVAAVARLDSAVGWIGARVKGGPAPFPVAVMIPYPDPLAESVTFEGKRYEMNVPDGRSGLATAYIDRVRNGFGGTRYKHLRLDAFYWFRENCPPTDTLLVQRVAGVVHARGLRFLWIPYFRAVGFDHWRALGFDEGWLQPNYFFHLEVPQTRLDSAATSAQANGLGIEIEFDKRIETAPAFWDRLGPYLSILAVYPKLRARSIALFDGAGALIDLSRGKTLRERALYERLAESLSPPDSAVH